MLIIALILICQWSEPINVSNTPPGGQFGSNYPALAFDEFHTAHFVWAECYNMSNGLPDIFYTKQISDTFVVATNISNTPSISFLPDIVIDRYNRIHVVWSEWISGAGAYIFWRKKEGETWSSVDTLSINTEGVANIARAVTDTLGRVHVVWDQNISSRYYTNTFYRYYDGENWLSPIKLNALQGAMNPDIAIDLKQQLHIVWQQAQIDSSTGRNIELVDIFYRKFDGITWSEIKNISNLPYSASCHPRIAVDGRGYVYVVWEESGIKGLGASDYSCWFSFSDGDDWSHPQIFEGTPNRYPKVAVNNEGKGCISWSWGIIKSKFFYNSHFTEKDTIGDKSGIIRQLEIDNNDTVYAVFGCRESQLHNDTEIYYSKCTLPNFSESSNTQFAYLTFIGKANIPYKLSEGGNVTFDLYDSLGRLIKRADLGYKPAGFYVKPVSLASFKGAGGVYFYHIYTPTSETKGKLVLPK